MIPIPPQLIELAAKYGGRALAILILILTLTAGYFYWKHEISSKARDEAIADCNESKERFRIDADHFKFAKQKEVDELNAAQEERLKNAVKTYINHYESLRGTPAAASLRIKTNSSSSSCNSMPGTNQSGAKTKEGTSGIGEAELSSGNLRQLNEVIFNIEQMELKCEQLLNSVP